jgi:hypothetical protein
MIISHKYKYIFLKTNKTAGTSIEIALSKLCGEKDIITPITPEDEMIRYKLGYRGPQNFGGFYNHISGNEVRRLIGENLWNDYYKFCFERNPWDRVISLYYDFCRTEPRPEVWQFIGSGVLQILKERGIEIYCIDGKIAVERVCKFENLQAEMDYVWEQLGFPEKAILPHAKGSFRNDKRHYREILDKQCKEIIDKIFADEIRLFGYEF